MDLHDSAPLRRRPFSAFSLTPLSPPAKSQAVHHIGRFKYSDDQLEYVLVNLEHPKGMNTIGDIVAVLRYKWPNQFRLLLESEVEMVLQWLYISSEVKRPSREVGSMDRYIPGQPLDPEYRAFERERHAFKRPEVTQLVNPFQIEFREAEASDIRLFAKMIEPIIVRCILVTKLFSDLSSIDIALGINYRLFNSVGVVRFAWQSLFTESHVETIWYHSKLAQTESFKMMARRNRHARELRGYLCAYKTDLAAGRADETWGPDPRCFGNERSAADLVEEIIYQFLSCVDGKNILEKCLSEQCMAE